MAKELDQSRYFYVSDGSVLKSLGELKVALPKMADDVYNYHAGRGDWANWIEFVFGKKALADKAKGASRIGLAKML